MAEVQFILISLLYFTKNDKVHFISFSLTYVKKSSNFIVVMFLDNNQNHWDLENLVMSLENR